MIKEVQPKSVVKCEETVHKLPRKLAYIYTLLEKKKLCRFATWFFESFITKLLFIILYTKLT